MAAHVTIYLVAREDTAVFGLWCPKCLLPSGFEMEFDRISEHGVTPRCMLLRKCHDCDTPIPRDEMTR